MNLVIDTLFLRRPKLDYLSPAICEAIFSSTGFPTIILNEIGKTPGPTGLVMGGTGGRRFSWNNYPGALCYNVYTAVIEPTTITECEQLAAASLTITYQLLFECHVEPFVIVPHEGCYRISAITPDGESDLSDPICTCNFTPPTTLVCNEQQTAVCTPPDTGSPVTVPAGVFCVEVPNDSEAIAEAQAQMNTLALNEATSELVCSPPSPPGGLSAYWKLDETNGIRIDQKGAHNLSEIGGVTGAEPGIINDGSTYTGTIGRVLQSSATETFPGDWSISTWVLSRATHGAGQFDNNLFIGNIDDSTNQGQFSMGWYDSVVANGIFLTLISPSQFIAGVFVPIDMTPYYGSWTHLAFTWTAPVIRFYVNGALMFTKDMSADVLDFNSGLSQDATPIAIGGAVNGSIIEHAFKGAVDETGTWDRLLSDAEILALYNGGAGLPYGSPGFPP